MLKEKLKELREDRNLTKKQAANGIGITERAYIAYEYGERDVSTDTLVKIANFYGVTTDYLLDIRTDTPEPLEALANQKSMKEFEQILLKKYLELPLEQRDTIIKLLRDSVHSEDEQKGNKLD